MPSSDDQAPLLRLAPRARQCGPCTACCTVMRVSPLDKPSGTTCGHRTNDGCGIYAQRPSVCRDFTCLWLADDRDRLSDAHRPDVVGLVLTEADRQTPGSLRIAAREVFPGASNSPTARNLLAYLRQFVPVAVVPASASHSIAVTIHGHPMKLAA